MRIDWVPGMAVYYYTPTGDSIPATVVRIGPRRVLIEGNWPDGDYRRWVAPANLWPQKETQHG